MEGGGGGAAAAVTMAVVRVELGVRLLELGLEIEQLLARARARVGL